MANLNVNRNVADAFYRYKMPRLIAKVEGKGNGIKTVIVNMSDIAKSLSRPPTYPTKYFGCELGAQTQFDPKNDRYIVNGSHESTKLQDLLDGFIRKFVLCPECENPETNLTVLPKKGVILQRCIACGHQANVDMRHKLTTYIVKNPPEPDSPGTTGPAAPASAPSSGKKGKKGKGAKENGKDENDDHVHSNNKESRKSASTVNEDDVDWGEDTSAAAVQARMDALSGAAKTLTISDDVEKTQQERVDIFYSFVKQRKTAGHLSSPEKEKEVMMEAERLDIKEKAPLVLAELLYDANIVQQIKQYRTLFLRFTHENPKAQRCLLGGFEQLVGNVYRDALMAKVTLILKTFYDLDILDEQVLIEWGTKPSKKYISLDVCKEIHSKAEAFIKWLKEAEEEESSEDDENDDVEVVYDDGHCRNHVPASVPAAGGDDDFNIDDI